MTPKQKLRSLEKKMERIQERNTEVDMKVTSRRFYDIATYYDLQLEHFRLQFEIEHCKTCGKKL
jgi:hypothetical protein